MTQFFMAMIPPTVTAQMHKVMVKNGKPVFYDPPKVTSAKTKLMAYLSKHKPPQPYSDGVMLTVKWLFPKGRHQNGEYRTTKPDTDNLQKLLKDCMTKSGFWKDDALVASEHIEKFWADVPGIFIRIEKLEAHKQCNTCKWHDDFVGACCNGDSEYRADFTNMDFCCDKWEEDDND